MPTDASTPLVRETAEVNHESVSAAKGLSKGVLVNEDHGAADVALRRFVLDPGATVPEHTNDVEHVQYVLDGEYVVGIDGEEYHVSGGDALHIPAGTVHWYRNESERDGVFLCAVPTGDDEIQLVE